MLGLIDYAKNMNKGNILTGFLLLLTSLTFMSWKTVEPNTSSTVFLQLSTVALYGILTIIGGFLQGETLYLRYFMTISTVLGLLLTLLLFIPGLVSTSMWFNMMIVSLIFIAGPSTALTYLNRESRFENERDDESDYLRRD